MSREDFVATFGAVFEHSRWIAEQTFDYGFHKGADTLEAMHKAMCKVLRSADPGSRLGVLMAHPDLAGKLALAGELSEGSAGEQASAGLDRCTPEEYKRFEWANAQYRERFIYPFIMAVKGKQKAEILEKLLQRLANEPDQERATAFAEVERIAWFRLEDIFGGAGE
jgi:OHCU decarboxylase